MLFQRIRGLFLYPHSLTPAPGDPGPSLFRPPLALHAHSTDIFCRQNTHSHKIIKYKGNIMIFKVALADSKQPMGKEYAKTISLINRTTQRFKKKKYVDFLPSLHKTNSWYRSHIKNQKTSYDWATYSISCYDFLRWWPQNVSLICFQFMAVLPVLP